MKTFFTPKLEKILENKWIFCTNNFLDICVKKIDPKRKVKNGK